MTKNGKRKKNRKIRRKKQKIVFNAVVSRRKRKGGTPAGGRAPARALIRRGVVVAVMVAAVAGIWSARELIIKGAGFRVTRVVVNGEHLVPAREIKSIACVKIGSSLLALDLDGVRDRIRAHPDIRDVEVTRRIPGKVIIKVFERFPVVAVHCGRRYVLDEEGIVLSHRKEMRNKSLPVLTGLTCGKVTEGDRLKSGALEKALDIVSIYRQSKLCRQLDLISIDLGDLKNIILRANDIEEIRLGDRDVKERMELLSYILEQRKNHGINSPARYIDLRWNNVAEMPASRHSSNINGKQDFKG
jgi:cell division protein FtsQ